MVNGDILHIVALDQIDPYYFRIKVGIATIYRSEITLNCSISSNSDWLFNLADTYKRLMKKSDYDEMIHDSLLNFDFQDTETMIKAIERSLNAYTKYFLPVFNSVNSLEDVIDYLCNVNFNGIRVYGPDVKFYGSMTSNDGLLVFLLKDPSNYALRLRNIWIKNAHDGGFYNEQTEAEIEESFQSIHNYVQSIISDDKMYKETMDRIEIRKNRNIDILKSLKIIGGKEK